MRTNLNGCIKRTLAGRTSASCPDCKLCAHIDDATTHAPLAPVRSSNGTRRAGSSGIPSEMELTHQRHPP